MAGQNGIPIYNSAASDALVTSINYTYGMRGAGHRYRFRQLWGRLFFRDSSAQMRVSPDGSLEQVDRSAYPQPGSPLQSMNGIYPLFEAGAREVIAKGMTEGRTRADMVGAIETNVITATRWDNKCTPIPLRAGYDPTGLIERKILVDQTDWANYLPLKLGLGALVNGTIAQPAGPAKTLRTYANKALFATDHPVNPNDKKLKGRVFSNSLTIGGSTVTEQDWASIKTKIKQVPGFDGVTLVHADMTNPIIYCPTDEQALFWLRFIGGEKAINNMHLQPLVVNGVPIGVSSVSLGEATIIVDPYLFNLASDQADIQKRVFIDPNTGSLEPLIEREEQVPVVSISKPTDYQGFNNKVIEVVSDAILGFGLGDPRGIFEVRTS